MPELPEVETIRRDLEKLVGGLTIDRVRVLDKRLLQGFGPGGAPRRRVDPDQFSRAVVGRTVAGVIRRGKYLVFDLGSVSLLAHLRMTGRLVVGPPDQKARAVLSFRQTPAVLNVIDTRRFGELWLAPDWRRDPSIAALGPEPLEPMDEAAWGRSLRRSGAALHSALLDQKRMAGLGNIYVTEALHLSGLRPTRKARAVPEKALPVLLKNIREVLERGLADRGVSFRDYRDAQGQKGLAQKGLFVYGKGGLPCSGCGSLLVSVKVGGRGTVYCRKCQK
jgi:formamidopyrimidine-DNA glycosylase